MLAQLQLQGPLRPMQQPEKQQNYTAAFINIGRIFAELNEIKYNVCEFSNTRILKYLKYKVILFALNWLLCSISY